MTYPSQCKTCKHFHRDHKGWECDAFPDFPGIPLAILNMEFDHRKPYEGDHGIQWEPREPGTKNPFDEHREAEKH